MAYRDLNTLSVREQVQHKYARRAAKLVNVFQCLIVSANPERRRTLDRAASESGWKTHVCADAQAALAHVNRWLVQLAVVDLDTPSSATFRPLVEQLAAQSGLLSIVCGHDGDVQEEIWVRQQGAWMYLPGVADSSNVGLLCSEAKQIVERISQAGDNQREPVKPVA